MPESSMPSTMLEQEAQMLGLRDMAFSADMGSPQQMQIRGFMIVEMAEERKKSDAGKFGQ